MDENVIRSQAMVAEFREAISSACLRAAELAGELVVERARTAALQKKLDALTPPPTPSEPAV